MTSTSGQIRREDADGVLTLTFTRDDKLNSLTDEMLAVLRQAVDDLGDDEDLRVLVITAEGRYFTAGMDVGRFGADAHRPTSGVAIRRDYRRVHVLFDELESIEKPVILGAQGPCLGAGVEMAVSCDFRFASERTVFGLPEITNLALIPGSGGISRLTRIVGPHWARWLAMAGERIDADEALRIGLVHRVLAEENFAAEVQGFARRLTGLSREALGLAKVAIDAAASIDRTSARNVDRIANTLLLTSSEHRDAVAAFQARKRG